MHLSTSKMTWFLKHINQRSVFFKHVIMHLITLWFWYAVTAMNLVSLKYWSLINLEIWSFYLYLIAFFKCIIINGKIGMVHQMHQPILNLQILNFIMHLPCDFDMQWRPWILFLWKWTSWNSQSDWYLRVWEGCRWHAVWADICAWSLEWSARDKL